MFAVVSEAIQLAQGIIISSHPILHDALKFPISIISIVVPISSLVQTKNAGSCLGGSGPETACGFSHSQRRCFHVFPRKKSILMYTISVHVFFSGKFYS